MLTAFLALIMVASIVAIGNWRAGIFAMILVGVLQDPLRKLTAGVPGYFILGAALVFIVVALSAFARNSLFARNSSGSINSLFASERNIRAAWVTLATIIILQAVHALRWGNPLLPVLGLITYFAPVIAVLVGSAFADSERSIRRFMLGYVAMVVPACLTVYLSVKHGDSIPVLAEVGVALGRELVISAVDRNLDSHPGIFRVGEIAAWHAATAASFLIILATQNRSLVYRLFAAAVVVLLVGAIILTGRRKMLMALTIFLASQWTLLAMFRYGAGRLTVTLLSLAVFGSFALTLLDPASEQAQYVERSKTVFGDAGERLGTAFNLMQSAIYRSSGIGLGAGAAAQGARYVGGAVEAVGGAGEAGIGQIIVELGIPGGLAVVWLLISLALWLFRNLGILARTSNLLLHYSVSLFSLLIANIATFLVASQLYGDLLVMIILGLLLGMLLSVNRVGIQIDTLRHLSRFTPRRVSLSEEARGSGEVAGEYVVKGNINRRGEKIYHAPWSRSYKRTRVNAARGERWFRSEDEALAAGWRAPHR